MRRALAAALPDVQAVELLQNGVAVYDKVARNCTGSSWQVVEQRHANERRDSA